jgi:hypothetical protein
VKQIAALKFDQLVSHGWESTRAAALANKHRGIMLTSIAPGSPRPRFVASGRCDSESRRQGYSDCGRFYLVARTGWTEQFGGVHVMRPDQPVEMEFNVKLSQMLEPSFNFNLRNHGRRRRGFLYSTRE